MIRVFIGYDPREDVAVWRLAKDLTLKSSQPLSITPIVLNQTPLTRPKEGSTEFAISRFLVPYLCNYEGHAIFMDCDILCRDDIAKLWGLRGEEAVKVVKHDYQVSEGVKFLGERQRPYPRKNWSSVMLFNNSRCKTLTPEYVNSALGLNLHQFAWTESIGDLPERWNYLVGHSKTPNPALVHFTLGGPWFPEYRDAEYASEWLDGSPKQSER